MKRDGLEGKDGLASVVHRSNLMLEAAGGRGRLGTEPSQVIDVNWKDSRATLVYSRDSGNKGRGLVLPDAHRTGVAELASVTDINVVIAGSDLITGGNAKCYVVYAACLVGKGTVSNGCIEGRGEGRTCVIQERLVTITGVAIGDRVV